MSPAIKIEFSRRALARLESITDYIDRRSGNREKARKYIIDLRDFISQTLGTFPLAGRPCPDFGAHTHKLVYRGFSILYLFDEEKRRILILTIYRENLP